MSYARGPSAKTEAVDQKSFGGREGGPGDIKWTKN